MHSRPAYPQAKKAAGANAAGTGPYGDKLDPGAIAQKHGYASPEAAAPRRDDRDTVLVVVQLAGGFDKHANQLGNYGALLHELSESVTAFVDDLKGDKLLDRVRLMTFSEFGRTAGGAPGTAQPPRSSWPEAG